MPELAWLLVILAGMGLLVAAALKAGEFVDKRLRIKGSVLFGFVAIGLLLSAQGWENYFRGSGSLWDAALASLLLGGLPFIAVASIVAHELPVIVLIWIVERIKGWFRRD